MLDRADEMDLRAQPADYDGTFRELLNEKLEALPEEEDEMLALVEFLRS
jgi:hypothetical protein